MTPTIFRPARALPFALQWLRSACIAAALLAPKSAAYAAHDVLTYRYNLNRDGANTNETILSPANVKPATFGKLFSCPVDGFLYAQPLYMSDVTVPGQGVHNIVFAATENNTVYAYDADGKNGTNNLPLWVTTFNQPGVTSVPISDWGLSDYPAFQLGITGTPVIDRDTGTLYVVAKIKDTRSGSAVYSNQLYALDTGTGLPKFGSPVAVSATYPGPGTGGDGTTLTFDPFYNFQRPALLLLDGVVYIGFASAGDEGPYHGWLIGYDARTLQQVRVFNSTPNSAMGGIWMAGSGPAADSDGYIYLATGNGPFSPGGASGDYGDSMIKLQPSGSGFQLADYFTPSDQGFLQGVDGDLGSGGVVLFPDSAGSPAHPHLAGVIGKDANLYVVDRDNMGKYTGVDDSQIVQVVPTPASSLSTPAIFAGQLYQSDLNTPLAAYSIGSAQVNPTPSSQSAVTIGSPGSVPTVSANGSADGIVWSIQTDAFGISGAAVLRAFDATDLAVELYNSTTQGSRDQLGIPMKFSVPITANGKVYVGTGDSVAVFGLLNGTAVAAPKIAIDQQSHITVIGTAGGTYSVQFSTDLSAGSDGWTTFATITLSKTSQTISDPSANTATRFYRAVVGVQ